MNDNSSPRYCYILVELGPGEPGRVDTRFLFTVRSPVRLTEADAADVQANFEAVLEQLRAEA